ncbi:MAG: hypothetical protein ACK5SX_04300, partial [Sandaracinobacter sp.]
MGPALVFGAGDQIAPAIPAVLSRDESQALEIGEGAAGGQVIDEAVEDGRQRVGDIEGGDAALLLVDRMVADARLAGD